MSLVLNLATGMVSPQYHVCFDSLFETLKRQRQPKSEWQRICHFWSEKKEEWQLGRRGQAKHDSLYFQRPKDIRTRRRSHSNSKQQTTSLQHRTKKTLPSRRSTATREQKNHQVFQNPTKSKRHHRRKRDPVEQSSHQFGILSSWRTKSNSK